MSYTFNLFYNYQNQNFLFALQLPWYLCFITALCSWRAGLYQKTYWIFHLHNISSNSRLGMFIIFCWKSGFFIVLYFHDFIRTFYYSLVIFIFSKNKITFSNEHNNEIFNDFKTKNYLSNILTVINSRADIVLLSVFYNFELVGLYVIAKSIASQLNLVANSINSLLYGHFLSVQDNVNDFRRILFYLAIIVLLLSLLIIIFGKGFISLFFGESYFACQNCLIF